MPDVTGAAETSAYEAAYNEFMLGFLDELLPWVDGLAQREPLDAPASAEIREELRGRLRTLDRWHDAHPPPPETAWPAVLPGNFATPGEPRPSAALQRLMDAETQWRGRLTEVVDGAPLRALYGPLEPGEPS